MFVAHLRGLLQPDYPQGRQSRIREVMLCRALDREQQGTSLIAATQANLELLSGMPFRNGNDLLQMHNEAMRMLAIGHDLQQQHPAEAISKDLEQVDEEPIQKMAELLNVLKASDIRDMLPLD